MGKDSVWKTYAIMSVFSFVPYAAVAWLFTAYVDATTSWWTAFLLLLLARTFFGVIEFLGTVLSWRLYGKGVATRGFLHYLHQHKLPPRRYREERISEYLQDTADDEAADAGVRRAAQAALSDIVKAEEQGPVRGWRVRSAGDAALDLYSPRHLVPKLGEDG